MPAIGFIKPFRRGGLRGVAVEAGDRADDDVHERRARARARRGLVAFFVLSSLGWTPRLDVAGKEHKGDV